MAIDLDGAVALVAGGANDIGAAAAGGWPRAARGSWWPTSVSFPPTGVQAACFLRRGSAASFLTRCSRSAAEECALNLE
jgi:hypothetical protein